jgi:hypothetical protein
VTGELPECIVPDAVLDEDAADANRPLRVGYLLLFVSFFGSCFTFSPKAPAP